MATCFAEKYEMTGAVLGSGSMGRVETCLEKKTRKEVAVKVMKSAPFRILSNPFDEIYKFSYLSSTRRMQA